MREPVSKFDFNMAFKALSEIDYEPVKRTVLKETLKHKKLNEDVFDISGKDGLEAASDERANEIAKAKLDKIEKIVDLEADSIEDILPSYVGKVIIQCPQCKTLIYKDKADIVRDENSESDLVNANEECQQCGNLSGYELVGQVAEAEAPVEEAPVEEDEFDLSFDEPEVESGLGADLDEMPEPAEETEADELEKVDVEEEPAGEDEKEEDEEEKKEESFDRPTGESLKESVEDNSTYLLITDNAGTKEFKGIPYEKALAEVKDAIKYCENPDYLTIQWLNDANGEGDWILELENVEDAKDWDGERFPLKDEIRAEDLEEIKELFDAAYANMNESLTESANIEDLTKKLKEHNDYIEYLQGEIKKAEEELKAAKNEFIKSDIQRKIDALNDALDKAIPEEVKAEKAVDDLPTPEEAGIKESACKATSEDLTEEVQAEPKWATVPEIIEKLKKDNPDFLKKFEDPANKGITPEKYVQAQLNKVKAHYEKDKTTIGSSYTIPAIYLKEDVCKTCGKELKPGEEPCEKCKEKEELKEANDSLDYNPEAAVKYLFNSKEFNTPVSKAEVEKYLSDKYDGVKEGLQEAKDEEVEEKEEEQVEDVQAEQIPVEEAIEKIEEVADEIKEVVDADDEQAEAIDEVVEEKKEEICPECEDKEEDSEEEYEEAEDIEFDEIDEKSFDECFYNYLNEVYSNVSGFTTTNCTADEKTLVVEGKINFKSGKTKDTKFTFNKEANKTHFLGINEGLSSEVKYELSCGKNKTTLIAESLKHN